ncbi:ATP-binding protein [Calothrix sp. FACHB-1219]|uniref:ATP-binding protein n=1 Tax=unclassified Calothrix TaxID=2619626 RepID=UPI0016850B24|nr:MULTISPECIES: ATP-binding protein [unclassified Calothrix]MBD2202738.1 ATP-binding protein [Calothrix sp. FACHB-168]MBD2218891.1 ATP-binding protein [Calothrix sp. FACHB-1219]
MVGNDWIEVKVPSAPKTATTATWVEMKLPNAKTLMRYCAWGIGRVIFSTAIFSVVVSRNALKLGVVLCDWFESGVKHLLKVYDALPYAGVPMTQIIEASATVIEEPLEIITDIIAAIEGKQVMIIGEMGTGKSTLAQYLAYTVGGSVKVYECEGTPEDWQGLEVIGKGEDWPAIEQGMAFDLEDLSNQLKLRTEKGDGALLGTERVIIAEEYPELAAKVPSAGEWLERHARRGRKAKRFTVLLSQYDRVAAWGLEGKSDLADAFFRIRLGKKAQAHAKSLKNNQLVEWLKLDKSHALLDDQPLRLPPYRDMKAATQRYGSTMLQPSTQNAIATEKPPKQSPKPASDEGFGDSSPTESRLIWRMIQRFGADKSDSAIVTELLGYTGKRYDDGVQLLQRLRREFGN